MQDKKRELEKLIQQYASGQLTDLEQEHLTQWMQELDVSAGELVDLAVANQRMKERIDARLMYSTADVKSPPLSWQFVAKIAALVLFCFSFAWYLSVDNTVELPKRQQAVSAVKPLPQSVRMTCTVAQDSVIALEDGSKVRLMAHSTLSWLQPFPKEQRAIQLEGKAFFEVAHDQSRPFTVLAGNIVTTALGTSFWVTQDRKNAKPRVRLIAGKVSIKERSANGEERFLAYLTPGQSWREPVIPLRREEPRKSEQPEEKVIPIILTFQHKPLAEVLPALTSFYHTTIVFAAADVSGLTLYGTYTQENDVAQILQTICIANDLELTFNAETNTYTIVKNRP
ncbi:FecR family protein [Sphingobacterium multivorum]|uniref:FecR family protein n=1 Tax=Sphingobacterium multivorum TaxID=28454 RepID=UPI003DA60EF5